MVKQTKTKTTKTESRPRYVELLERVRTLKAEAKAMLFDRMTALVELFHDADYREKLRQGTKDGVVDDLRVAAVLDEYVDDTDFTFMQLRKIRETFTDVNDWQTRKLIDLWGEVARAVEPNETARKRRVVKQVEYQAVVAKADELKAKVATATKQLAEGNEHLTRTLSRVEELEAENQRLRLRVSILEAENRNLRAKLAEPIEAFA